MIRLLQIFINWPKKSASNFAILARTIEETRVSSTIIELNDTHVSTASNGVKIKRKKPIKWWVEEKKVEIDDIEHQFWTNRESRWKKKCKN